MPQPELTASAPAQNGGARSLAAFARIRAVALIAAAIWVLLSVGYWLAAAPEGGGALSFLALLLTIALPLALLWLLTRTLQDMAALRAEAEVLRAQMSGAAAPLAMPPTGRAAPERAAMTRAAPTPAQPPLSARAPAPPASGRAQPPAPTQPVQASLGFEPEPEPEALSTEDFIIALNFPDSPDDEEGFRALRRGLANRDTAKLIRSAQDVLTLLAQDGVFMDGLSADHARPEVWRRFAEGQRGRAVSALGGIHDRDPLEIAGQRMKDDPVFRDAAHHFLRQFDRSFASFEKTSSDAEIAAVGSTRTARAFMLLGRISGTFD